LRIHGGGVMWCGCVGVVVGYAYVCVCARVWCVKWFFYNGTNKR
jgi:hypothetical protein